MLKIWGRRNSINVQKAMWAVGETGVPHERIDAGGSFGGLDTDEFDAMNPNHRVPVIDDDGTIVWESHAIVRYIAAKYGAGSLWPEDPAMRARSDMWMDWVSNDLQPAFLVGVFWNFYRTPEDQRNWNAIRKAIARSAILFKMLDRHLETRPFVAGDTLTIGDIAAGAQLFRYFELEIDRPDLPNVEAWYARLTERPAYREHVMVPFDDLKGRLSF
ncbi:MAG TPA: glutathione S-transferase family protein [Rhizomicrobium sp.]|jgi:glutathione S-transferase|nr:glutathione S-transferase family protein [Rhizomicrobium sp.]